MKGFKALAISLGFPLLSISLSMAEDCARPVELYNRGTLSSDLPEKERLFKEALALPCKNREILAKIHNNLADTYEQAERFEEAIAEYRKATELDADLPTPYIGLGDVYARRGDLKSAGQSYKKYWQRTSLKTRQKLLSSLSLGSSQRAIRPVPSETLYFGFNRATPTRESTRQLEELLAALKEDELHSYRFQLIGYTDSDGSDAYNQGLSERRAGAVQAWLEAHGCPSGQLQTAGRGEKEPLADNRMAEGRRLNRRVEIRTIGLMVAEVDRSGPPSPGLELLAEGQKLSGEGRYQEAASAYQGALKRFREDHSREGIRAALGNLYLVYLASGEGEKARAHLEEFQRMDRK